MRDRYEEQLNELSRYVEEMGGLIVYAVRRAMDALRQKNPEEAESIIHYDERINHMERAIESLCLNLLLSQQPVATDLRMVSAALKMVTDMERIGDHAADISELTLLLEKSGYPENLDDIFDMAEEAMSMVKDGVDAYIRQDEQKARAVILRDDAVDRYFVSVKQTIIRQINENIQEGEQALDALMIAKYLERIGDHATNVAEWVLFYLTGNLGEEQD